MKKILKYAAALAVILPVACNKDMNPSEGLAPEGKTVKVTMNATVDDPVSKMLLNGNQFEWEVGDVAVLRWANQTYTNWTSSDSLAATSSGTAVSFEGEFTLFPTKTVDESTVIENLYAYYANDAIFANSGSPYIVKSIANVQTGKLEDIKDHLIYSTFITYKNMTTESDEDGNITSATFNVSMNPMFSLIKVTVPQELALTSIKLTTEANIAGLILVNPSKTSSTAIGGGSAQLINRVTNEGIISALPKGYDTNFYQEITISRNGEIISGDVYFTIIPDKYDGSYCCSAESLKFTMTTSADASYEFEAPMIEKIQMGELKNLGTIPADIAKPQIENVGSLCLLNDTYPLTVAVAEANTDYTYYYEIGSTASDCQTPTIASTTFDPATGFNPTLDECFIKVLVHSSDEASRDVVLRASLRNWNFKSTSAAALKLAATFAGTDTDLSEAKSSYTTSDGLVMYRTHYKNGTDSSKSVADLGYSADSNALRYYTNALAVNVVAEYDNANQWLYFVTNYYYNVGYKLFYNNSSYYGQTAINDNSVTASVSVDSDNTFTRKGIAWDLGSNNAGDMFAVRGDNKSYLYSIALLEVL